MVFGVQVNVNSPGIQPQCRLCPIFQARAGPANIQNPVFINYTLTNRVHLTSTETSYQ